MKRLVNTNFNNVFYSCVEDCSEAIMITDKRGTLIYVNPAWSQIYGYSFEEAMGNTPALIRSPKQTDEFYKKMWKDIGNPDINRWKGHLTNQGKDGSEVNVFLTITPYRGESEKHEIIGYMGIAVNMSEQKKLEKQVMHQDRLASVGLLASGLAHEIGTPLGTVRGRAEMLMMKLKNNSAAVSSLSVIISQIDRVSKLINSLLRVARSSDEVLLTKVNVKSVIAEIENLISERCKRSNIKLIVECEQSLNVFAEYSRLEQVLINLCINALHAIQDEKSFGKSNHFIKILCQQDDETVSIVVSDSGCGISNENLDKLFQPFFTTKDIGKGTGLGLAIVAKIIEELNSKITVSSKVGEGTDFKITIPIKP